MKQVWQNLDNVESGWWALRGVHYIIPLLYIFVYLKIFSFQKVSNEELKELFYKYQHIVLMNVWQASF